METKLQTLRFKFEENIIKHINGFSISHQTDDRKKYKSEWEKWMNQEDIKPMIEEECKRLLSEGFEGDVIDKMFKSSRYYYRKKDNNEKEKSPRKKYESLDPYVLETMDKHIHEQIMMNKKDSISKVSPALTFNDYLSINKVLLIEELKKSSIENKVYTKEETEKLKDRFKKTYKNRFFIIRNKWN
jgi:hypothetical protein